MYVCIFVHVCVYVCLSLLLYVERCNRYLKKVIMEVLGFYRPGTTVLDIYLNGFNCLPWIHLISTISRSI